MGDRLKWTLLARVMSFLAVVLICLSWTLWLMALTLFPNETINRIMDTAELDNGTFWHFADAPVAVGAVGVAGLAVAALGYMYVVWLVLRTLSGSREPLDRRRGSAKVATTTAINLIEGPSRGASGLISVSSAPTQTRTLLAQSKNRVVAELLHSGTETETWQRLSALVKVGDVVLHWIFLVQLLENGAASSLVVLFTAIVATHALTFAVVLALPYDDMGRYHIRLNMVFDFAVAVAFPLVLLGHALSTFTFDRPLMALILRVFPPGFFERYAANVADPVQVVAVRHNLMALQVNSVLKIFTRVGTMLALVRRSTQLARMLAEEHVGQTRQANLYARRHRWLSAAFVLVAVAFVVFAEESVRTSALACRPHKECAQHAHRWLFAIQHDDLSRCPCLAIVDRDIVVATHEQWLHPPDRTEKVAQLAAAGTVQTLQLVNRALVEFPVELRACKQLRHVSLYYTNTERLPEWFSEFTNLEYLLIDGKYPEASLLHLPNTLFDTMPKLAFLNLGIHGLAQLPSFDELTGLKSLTLAGLPHLTTLPRFDSLRVVEKVSIISTALIETFPELTNLHKLTSLTMADRGAVCCNGFLGRDKCDLSRSLCGYHPLWHAPQVTQCLSKELQASASTRAIFDKFHVSTCAGDIPPPGGFKLESTPDDVSQCSGTLYRRCQVAGLDGVPAMCYNTRWMVIACNTYPFAIEMRRQQIQLGLGQACDPVEEAWLGCGNSSIPVR